jgi:hypothetical protein
VTLSSGEVFTFVIKSTKQGTFAQSKSLRLAREGEFYKAFGEPLRSILSEVVFSFGDLETGAKLLVMEDLSDAVQTGYFFGPGSPLNWGKDLIHEQRGLHKTVTAELIVERSMMLCAKLNGLYWMRPSLLDEAHFSFLRGQNWLLGHGETQWQGLQANSKHSWEATKATRIPDPGYGVRWSPFMVSLIDASVSKISWRVFQERLQNSPWSLVHGDLHPANMMWKPDPLPGGSATAGGEEEVHTTPGHGRHHTHNLMLVDWELVGLGSGAQDIGQYMISHLPPRQRKAMEEAMVRLYFHQLLSFGINSPPHAPLSHPHPQYTWEQCWDEYTLGGAEKWIWLLALLSSMLPDPVMQFFHDQVEAFARDHEITPHKVGMPRL